MATEEQLREALRKADAAGDTAAAQRFAERIKEQRAAPQAQLPDRGFMQQLGMDALGALEGLATVGSGVVGQIAGGLEGIGESIATLDPYRGAERARSVSQSLTYEPRTQEGQAAIGKLGDIFSFWTDLEDDLGEDALSLAENLGLESPEAKAAFAAANITMLNAIPEMLGFKGTQASKVSKMQKAGLIDDKGMVTQKGTDIYQKATKGEDLPVEEVTKKVAKKDIQAAATADLDPAIIQSAERLDIDIPISAASQNKAFQEAAQSTKFLPGSELLAQEAAAIAKTQDIANNLVSDLRGGDLDVSGFDFDLGERFTKTIDQIKQSEKGAYNAVKETVGKRREVNMENATSYISERLADLGGDATGLSKPEKALHALVKKAEDGNVITYERLDALRKSIGEGYQKAGAFKDEATKSLDDVYNLITDIQEGVIGGIDENLLAAYQGAKKLTQQRKGIQDSMIRLFGRDAESGALAPKVDGAANALVKGNVKKFNQLLKDVPKDLHGDLSALILDRVLGFGSRTADGLGEGFVKAFAKLNKNKRAKETLYSKLPKGVGKQLDDIGRVWTGLIRSKALQNNSKTARDLFAAMDEGGALRNLLAFTAEETAPPGTRGIASKVVRAKGKSKLEKAEELITSKEFTQAAKARAMNKGNPEAVLANSKAYQSWFDGLDKATQEQIANSGFFEWLTSPAVAATPAIEETVKED